MRDAKAPKSKELQQRTGEGTQGGDFTRRNMAKREKFPSFIEQPMRDAGLLPENLDLKKGIDGKIYLYDKQLRIERPLDLKNTVEEVRKDNSVKYEQAKYDMIKHALSEAISLDVKNIKEVQKVEDGYKYNFVDEKGSQEGRLSLSNENIKKGIAAFEKQMADHGFQIEEPKSDAIKQAVLKQAAEKAAPGAKELIEHGAVQSYDPQSKKWYISKNGKIEEFSLDNQKIKQDAELYSIKNSRKMQNGDDIVEARFKKDQHDQYEVNAKKDIDPSIMQKMTGEKMSHPESQVTVLESKETDEEHGLKEIENLLDSLKDQREKIEKWGKAERRIITALMVVNQGASQADQNLNAFVELMQLGGNNGGIMPSTIQNSERAFKEINEARRVKIEKINNQMNHLEKRQGIAEKHASRLEKYKDRLALEKKPCNDLMGKQDLTQKHDSKESQDLMQKHDNKDNQDPDR